MSKATTSTYSIQENTDSSHNLFQKTMEQRKQLTFCYRNAPNLPLYHFLQEIEHYTTVGYSWESIPRVSLKVNWQELVLVGPCEFWHDIEIRIAIVFCIYTSAVLNKCNTFTCDQWRARSKFAREPPLCINSRAAHGWWCRPGRSKKWRRKLLGDSTRGCDIVLLTQ